MVGVRSSRHWPQRAPSPPKGGRRWDEGGVPRVLSLWPAPSPRPSPLLGGEGGHRGGANLNLTPMRVAPTQGNVEGAACARRQDRRVKRSELTTARVSRSGPKSLVSSMDRISASRPLARLTRLLIVPTAHPQI